MKKIFLFLFLVFSYNLFAECSPGSGPKVTYTATSNYPNGTTNFKQVYYPYAPWYGYFYLVTNVYNCAITIPDNTSPNCRFDNKGVLHCVDPNVPFPPSFDDNGNFQVLPNPDPSNDPSGRCNDLFVNNGQAYTCNPNSNEATPIPNSNGLAYDPESDRNVPNCNDGYDHTSLPTLVPGGSGSSYTSWGCAPSTGTGNTGTGSTGDGSDTGGDNGVGGSTGTGTGDTSTGNTGSTGGSGSSTGTGDTSTGGSGGSGGSVSGGGSTGGTGGSGDTGTTNPDSTDTTTPPATDNPDTGDNDNTTTTPPIDNPDNGDTTTPPTDGSNDGTGDNTDTTNGADSCNDPNLTLQEQMLCKLNSAFGGLGAKIDTTNSKLTTSNTYLKSIDTSLGSIKNQFTPNESINSNPLSGSASLIDGVINEYTTFKSNIITQGDTLENLVNSSIDTVNKGFEFNITSNEVLNCPKTYQLDLSALNMQNMNVILDICEQSSKLKPYFYPLFLILFSIGTTMITIRMLGVLI